jgi:uncharacterized membrane protein
MEVASLFRGMHIASGVVAFASAAVAVAFAKGSRHHRLAGWVFLTAMAGTTTSAILLTIVRPNQFLMLVAIFSAYLAFTGFAAWRSDLSPQWRAVEGAASVVMLILSLVMLGWGLAGIETGNRNAPMLLAFAGIGAGFAYGNVRRIRRPPEHRIGRAERLIRHISGMGGACIAVVSAISVVNLPMLPDWIRWLWPTVVGVPVIVWAIRRYVPRLR